MTGFQMHPQICEFLCVLLCQKWDFHIEFHSPVFLHTSWTCEMFQPMDVCMQIHWVGVLLPDENLSWLLNLKSQEITLFTKVCLRCHNESWNVEYNYYLIIVFKNKQECSWQTLPSCYHCSCQGETLCLSLKGTQNAAKCENLHWISITIVDPESMGLV